MINRTEILLASISRDSHILEVGFQFDPVASTANGWNTRTLGFLSREKLIAKYRDSPDIDVSRIEDVDYIWASGALSDAVPSALRGTFDGLIANSAIEYVPDLISFLTSASTLLKPDGILALAIPDKRYSIDYFQPLTTTGQVIEAHGRRLARPDWGRVFDHHAYAVQPSGTEGWGQHPSPHLDLIYTLDQARHRSDTSVTENVESDIRTWRFTPASFQLVLLELARLGYTDWHVERSTEAIGSEFFVWLRRDANAVAILPDDAFAERRLALLKRTLLETRAQIDWLLAGEPDLVTGPLFLLPTTSQTASRTPAASRSTAAEQSQAVPRYVDWLPARENAGRAFEGEWSSAVPGLPMTGNVPLFQDPRIIWFEEKLGGFNGKKVLELGPLEGGHTYMMNQRGASVTAIESNFRAWMRCLIVKDALDMFGATFLLGDFVRYLASSPPHVDFVLASGVLYHMTDPVDVLHNICEITDAIGLWTHYFDPDNLAARSYREKFDFSPREFTTPHGRTVELYSQRYLQALEWAGFCGGSAPGSNWLRRQDILGILEDEGFDCETFQDQPDHPNGPAFCVFAKRR